jgi:integrase
VRLRVGCARRQRTDVTVAATGESLKKDEVCFLEVPTNKTSTAFTKPVHPLVEQRIAEWERKRPTAQPVALDRKSAEQVHLLFSVRNRPVAKAYLNDSLIPILCRKAGVPESDSRGKITSHRARATIASQLYNAADPLSLAELQQWLGHKDPKSTQSYARIDPTRLARKYADSGYLERNIRRW